MANALQKRLVSDAATTLIRRSKSGPAPRGVSGFAVVLVIVLVVFAVVSLVAHDMLGIYPDAINPDYLAVRMLHPSRHTVAWILPGNFLSNHWPILAGGLYHGSLHAYFAMPFAAFGPSVLSFALSHIALGILVLIAEYVIAARATENRALAISTVALTAVDPAFIYAWKTPAYITIFPDFFGLLAAALLVVRSDTEQSRRNLFCAGALLGVAVWGYFIQCFFIPAFVAFLAFDGRSGLREALRRIGCFLAGVVIGALLYVVGYALLFHELGLVEGIDWIRHALAGLGKLDAAFTDGLSDRFFGIFSNFRAVITGDWERQRIFGSGGGTGWGWAKIMLLAGPPIVAAPFARNAARTDRGYWLIVLSFVSFLASASIFGRSVEGHHFSALVPWVYVAFGLSCSVIWSAAGARARAGIMVAAAAALLLVAINIAALTDELTMLRHGDAARLYSRVINDYPLEAQARYAAYDHVFLDWGIILPFVYLTNGKVPAYMEEQLEKEVCSGRPVRLVLARDHATDAARDLLASLKVKGQIKRLSPGGHTFEYVVVTLAEGKAGICKAN